MKRILSILLVLLLPFIGISQVTTFALPTIPLTTDFLNADRGAHLWIKRDDPYGTIDLPFNSTRPARSEQMVDYYYRFSWTHFFTGTGSDSTINWSFFRARMSEATAKRMGIRFRVMSNGVSIGNPPNDNFNNLQNYAGGWQNIPQFLHDLMQAEPDANNRDILFNSGSYNCWVPNTNSPQYKRWVRKFSQQLRNYIDTAVINGHPLRFAIRIYDLGFYGCFSEQHSACICNQITDLPSGFRPNNNDCANLIEIVDAQMDAMGGNSNWKYVVPFNAFDAVWLGHTLNCVSYGNYLLNHPDSIGWINDHIGADESYDHSYLENNFRINNAKLMNRWKFAPIGGEPVGWGQPADRSAIPAYVNAYHKSFFGNGNLDHIAANGQDDDGWPTEANNIRTASRQAGYRLKFTGGFYNPGASLVISANWINEGNAPIYFPWTVQYLIKNGASTVATLTSSFNPRYFQPSASSITHQQAFAYPAIPSGQYGLYVIVKDANNYRNPMFLANTPRQSDGSYFLGNITIPVTGSNQPPIANAGANQSISATSVSLNGSSSSDPDGTITTYAWARVSGPNTPTIVSPSSATTNVTGLVSGVYVFRLTVTDNGGATAFDDVQITVGTNQPPVANAGANVVLTLPTNFTQLNGTGSTDDVGIVSYDWQKISGPATYTCLLCPSNAVVNVESLQLGTYVFRLTVTDASGATSFDDVQITVVSANTAPIANAGPNASYTQPILNFTTILLDGSLSSDPGGAISTYLWTQVGGPSVTITAPTNVSTFINNVTVATNYVFRLTVTDNGGLTASDDVQITVNATTPVAPIANAGADQTIQLPTNSVIVSSAASTDDVAIVSRVWSKVSGPSSFSIVSPTAVSTSITTLVAGVYVFRVTVTDGGGLTDFDEVTITVLAAANTAPIAVAGNNQSITLPTNSTSVNGSGSTDDVAITVYLWTKVSGPTGGTITSPNSVSTTITGLTAGTYVFRLRVQDAQGLFDTDDLTIIVNPAANLAPVAIITTGTPTIQLPTNSVNLSGTSSTDDVAVTSYLWTQISGPATATIGTSTASITSVSNLVVGVYFFQLTVGDAGGLTDTDQIMITVTAADPPDPPILGNRYLFKTRGLKFLPRIP